ncbi:MBL fold metallo-hydrolase [Micrococcales bacterium 31B]|nr:MBL fold metallo-hydrolase [Micrococcales bacterium 31B]
MKYDGNVQVDGASAVRLFDTLVLRKCAVGPLNNNAYLLTCRVSGAQLLIDAADNPQRLQRLIVEGSPDKRLDTIVTTHSHFDHIGALSAMVSATGADTVAGAADIAAITTPIKRAVQQGDTVRMGVHDLEVIHLRGHTPGSIALVFREDGDGAAHIFTGDSLFPGGVGATQGDADRFRQLYTDVTERIFDRFDDHTTIYPGHGSDTTLGAERPQLAQWLERGW